MTHVELNSASNSKDTYLHIIDDYGFVVHTSKVNKNLSAGDYFNPYVTDLGNSEFMVQWTYGQNAGSSQTNGSFAQIYDYKGLKKANNSTLCDSDNNTGSGAGGKAVKISNSKFVLPTFKKFFRQFEIFNKYEREQVLIGKEFQLNTTAAGDQYNAIASWSDSQRLNHGTLRLFSVCLNQILKT